MRKILWIVLGVIAISVLSSMWYDHFKSREYLTQKAIEKNNPAICDKQGLTDTCSGFPCAKPYLCKMEVAIQNQNLEACALISDSYSETKGRCYGRVLKDIPIEDQYKTCASLQPAVAQSFCMEARTQENDDLTGCLYFTSQGRSENCLIQFVRKAKSGSALICDMYFQSDRCYQVAAKRAK